MDYKISLITPVYNAMQYIEEAFQSVKTQSIGFENIQWLLDGYETKEDFHQWAVRENGECVGRMMLTVSRRFHTGTVAYYLAESTWGKGYMTEILKRVIDFCFDDLGLNRVEADHFARNPASGRVMEKAGMTKEGLARQKYCKDGEFLDAVLYAIVKGNRE